MYDTHYDTHFFRARNGHIIFCAILLLKKKKKCVCDEKGCWESVREMDIFCFWHNEGYNDVKYPLTYVENLGCISGRGFAVCASDVGEDFFSCIFM